MALSQCHPHNSHLSNFALIHVDNLILYPICILTHSQHLSSLRFYVMCWLLSLSCIVSTCSTVQSIFLAMNLFQQCPSTCSCYTLQKVPEFPVWTTCQNPVEYIKFPINFPIMESKKKLLVLKQLLNLLETLCLPIWKTLQRF